LNDASQIYDKKQILENELEVVKKTKMKEFQIQLLKQLAENVPQGKFQLFFLKNNNIYYCYNMLNSQLCSTI